MALREIKRIKWIKNNKIKSRGVNSKHRRTFNTIKTETYSLANTSNKYWSLSTGVQIFLENNWKIPNWMIIIIIKQMLLPVEKISRGFFIVLKSNTSAIICVDCASANSVRSVINTRLNHTNNFLSVRFIDIIWKKFVILKFRK